MIDERRFLCQSKHERQSASPFELYFNSLLLVVNISLVAVSVGSLTALLLFQFYIDPSYIAKAGSIEQLLIEVSLVNDVWFSLIIAFALVGMVGVTGLLGVVRGRNAKKWLIAYLAMFILFICLHSAFFTFSAYESDNVESFLNSTIVDLGKSVQKPDAPNGTCVMMRTMSRVLSCCDVTGSVCCYKGTSGMCFEKLMESVKGSRMLLVLASWLVFSGEFVIILLVTFMLGSVNYETRHRKRMSVYVENTGFNPYTLSRLDTVLEEV